MSEELTAISKISLAPAALGDYDSICAALMQTARGRWFLQEYARRNRSADTQLLLAAVQRIEAVVCAEPSKQAQQGFRSDLIDMAKAITRTRAEVAEMGSNGSAPAQSAQAAGNASSAPTPPRSRDIFAAAERIRDVTWAMRGHGFEPATCDQLEELAASILSASSLRDPTDRRASKLSEVLQYLEHRIDSLLERSVDADPPAPEPAEPDHHPLQGAPNGAARPANGFAGMLVKSTLRERDVATLDAGLASTPAPQAEFQSARPAVDAEDGEEDADTAARSPLVDAETAPEAPASVSSPGPQFEATATEAFAPAISMQNHEVGWQSSDDISELAHDVLDDLEPVAPVADRAAGAELAVEPGRGLHAAAVALGLPAAIAAEPANAAQSPASQDAGAGAAGGRPQEAGLPLIEPADPSQSLPEPIDPDAVSPALQEAAAVLLEVDRHADMPGLEKVTAGGGPRTDPPVLAAPPEPAQPATDLATDLVGERLAASDPAEPAGFDTTPPDQPPSPATSPDTAAGDTQATQLEPATPASIGALLPQLSHSDPLATLKAMSEFELIALFS